MKYAIALSRLTNFLPTFHFQIRVVFLQWLPWFLRMSRPGDKITLKTMAATAKMRDQIRELEMKERSSKSLLANVLGKSGGKSFRVNKFKCVISEEKVGYAEGKVGLCGRPVVRKGAEAT